MVGYASAGISEEIQRCDHGNDDGGETRARKISVVGFDGAVLDPPAYAHDWQSVGDKDETNDADESEDRDEDEKEKGEERPGHHF